MNPGIPLRNRQKQILAVAIVDDEDYEAVTAHRWFLYQGYARRQVSKGPKHARVVKTILMHRQIMGLVPGDGLDVDHISRDRLDNRRVNLRVATRGENNQNTPARRNGTSAHRGVYWSKGHGKWGACARITGRTRHVGFFDDEHEAGRAVAAFRAEHMPYTVEAR